ncbi:MAG: hypothetical protein ACRCTE_00035 [Cellulosilyticaceae bacterium]
MYIKEDNTYQEMIQKSAHKWLEELTASDDLVNKHGAKLTLEYIAYLDKKIKQLEDNNKLKDEFLRRLKAKSNEHKNG